LLTSSKLRGAIIRILEGKELSSYSVYRMLSMKGLSTWPNHVYTLLSEMENKEGILENRWLFRMGKRPTRSHVYTLSKTGEE
jgi:DNA-binding PadR family transcriptional regulator